MKELDDIAKEACQFFIGGGLGGNYFAAKEDVRSAIDKAIELVLTREPSEAMLQAGYSQKDWKPESIYADMQAALLEELKTGG